MVKYGTSWGDINPMVFGRPVVEGVWVFPLFLSFGHLLDYLWIYFQLPKREYGHFMSLYLIEKMFLSILFVFADLFSLLAYVKEVRRLNAQEYTTSLTENATSQGGIPSCCYSMMGQIWIVQLFPNLQRMISICLAVFSNRNNFRSAPKQLYTVCPSCGSGGIDGSYNSYDKSRHFLWQIDHEMYLT